MEKKLKESKKETILPESTDDMFTSIRKVFWDAAETTTPWTNQQFSGWYDSLSSAISSSTAIMKPANNTILEYVSSAYEYSAKHVDKVINPATIFTNAL